MRARLLATAIAGFTLAVYPAAAQHDHQHAAENQVGKVSFANSCAPAAQDDLARAVAMLHSFWYGTGERTFREVLAKDPGCAIATWGIAALLMNNPLAGVGPTKAEAERAQAAIDEGRRIGAKTQRERDYIEAVAAYYQDWANRPERARQQSRSDAFEALAARYKDDDEAQIFSALYLAGTQSQADQSFAAYRKSASILGPMFAKYPDHPGVAHYLIHVYDAPPLAQQGLTAARRYAGIAPDAPHALHMPSHIFTRVGAWEESVTTNRRSFQVAAQTGEFGEAYHASDYAVYADLQLARDAAAREDMASVAKIRPGAQMPPAMAYAAAAMPARCALERGDWAAAARLEPAGGPPWTQSITWFARAIGGTRSGTVQVAEQSATELDKLHKALADAGNTYWAREVEVQQLATAAWIAFAQKRTDEGLARMRQAADLEDGSEKHIVTPGRILPARELLGDMLLEAGQPGAALREYEASQVREPNRFRGYYGAARAAEAAGDRAKAAEQYGKLLALAKDADGDRPELARARAFAAK